MEMKHTREVIRFPINALADALPHQNEKNPIVLRKQYDVSASLCRRKTKDSDAPAVLHMQGSTETPLVQYAAGIAVGVSAAVIVTAAVCMIGKMRMRAKIRRRYAQKYAQKQNKARETREAREAQERERRKKA